MIEHGGDQIQTDALSAPLILKAERLASCVLRAFQMKAWSLGVLSCPCTQQAEEAEARR